jgi:hypothetical protein
MNDLTLAQRLLLARLAGKGDKAARSAIVAGEYTVAPFTVTVGGTLTISEDTTYAGTTSIPLLATMVVALHRAGVQREGIANIIIDAAKVAAANGGKVEGALAAAFDYVEGELEELKARLAEELPRKPRKGSVRVKGSIR